MPYWVLVCPECRHNFAYSKIKPPDKLTDAFGWLGEKPAFPNGAITLHCPHCNKASSYERHQLIYSDL
jgi:uncharacterized protein YbaR (Trm112 family)